jgi:type I restriction enzyme, R subunit
VEKYAKQLASIADKHGITADSLRKFVEQIMERMIFDGEKLSDLLAPLELGWKARTKADQLLFGYSLLAVFAIRIAGD